LLFRAMSDLNWPFVIVVVSFRNISKRTRRLVPSDFAD
jgi:hypothetical protein